MILKTLFLCVLFAGCSTIHYRSRNRVPVQLDHNPKHNKITEIKGSEEFYLGGFIPRYQEVFIDEVVGKAGYKGMSKITIEDRSTFFNMLISVCTLGFYTPRDYVIRGFTEE